MALPFLTWRPRCRDTADLAMGRAAVGDGSIGANCDDPSTNGFLEPSYTAYGCTQASGVRQCVRVLRA